MVPSRKEVAAQLAAAKLLVEQVLQTDLDFEFLGNNQMVESNQAKLNWLFFKVLLLLKCLVGQEYLELHFEDLDQSLELQEYVVEEAITILLEAWLVKELE